MAETPEAKVKRKIKEVLKTFGEDVYYFMPAMGSFGKSGVPDIIACVHGAFVGIEVKADKRKNPPTDIQKKNLAEIAAASGAALVIDANDLDFLKGFIEGVIANRKDTAKFTGAALKRYME